MLLLAMTLLLDARYVVYPSEQNQITPRQQALLFRSVAVEVAKVAEVVSTQNVNEASCAEQSASCWARLSAKLNADGAIVVRVSTVEDTDVVSLLLLDPRSGEVRKLATRSAANALDAVGALVADVLDASAENAGVALDWRARWRPKPLHLSAFATTTALTGASAIVALSVGMASLRTQGEYQALANQGRGVDATPVSGAELQRLGRKATLESTVAMGFAIGAGVLGLTSILIGLFTDFGSDKVWLTGSGVVAKF